VSERVPELVRVEPVDTGILATVPHKAIEARLTEHSSSPQPKRVEMREGMRRTAPS
jgi:hypothetical protein